MSVMQERMEPACDGRCRPDLALYHARCPAHGLGLRRLVLDIEAANAAERAHSTRQGQAGEDELS